jgi:hypothetical protein
MPAGGALTNHANPVTVLLGFLAQVEQLPSWYHKHTMESSPIDD